MRPDLRHISIVGILMWSLLQAWFGHDLSHSHAHQGHGHHGHQVQGRHEDGRHDHGHAHQAHQSSDEAAHTRAVYRGNTNVAAELAPVALLIGFCEFSLPDPVELIGCLEVEIELRIDPQFLERPHSPRAPPAFSSIV